MIGNDRVRSRDDAEARCHRSQLNDVRRIAHVQQRLYLVRDSTYEFREQQSNQ